MPIVLLGNHAALDHQGNPVEGQQVTSIHVPDVDTHRERMRTITHETGLWPKLASEDAVWVASDDERLARALGAHFDCPVIDMADAGSKHALATRAAALGVKLEDLDPEASKGDTVALTSAGDGGELE